MEYNGVLLKWQQCKYPKIISMPDKASSKSVILVINSQFKKNTWTTWNLSPFILNNAVYSKCSNRDPTGWEVTLFSFLFLFLSLNQSITTLFFLWPRKMWFGMYHLDISLSGSMSSLPMERNFSLYKWRWGHPFLHVSPLLSPWCLKFLNTGYTIHPF